MRIYECVIECNILTSRCFTNPNVKIIHVRAKRVLEAYNKALKYRKNGVTKIIEVKSVTLFKEIDIN